MRRYIVLLLIKGIVWAQTDFDKLVLKDGTTYLGEYSKIEGEIVYFKPQNAFTFQPISIKQIQTLELKDGHFIIVRGYAKKIPLAIEEYQKLSTKEKAIYDAKSKNLSKWVLYGSIIPIITSVYNEVMYWTGGPRISIAFQAAITTIPSYSVLNRKEKFNFPKSIMTDSEKEIYEQAYSKELRKRKSIHFLSCSIVDVALSLMSGSSRRSFNMSGGGGGGKGFTGFGP